VLVAAADCVRHGGAGEEPAEPVANVTLISTPLLITRQKENLGETQARGFEVSGQSRVTDKIVVSGSYWFVNSIVLHQNWTAGVQARFLGNQFDDDQNRLPLGPAFSLDAQVSRSFGRHVALFFCGAEFDG